MVKDDVLPTPLLSSGEPITLVKATLLHLSKKRQEKTCHSQASIRRFLLLQEEDGQCPSSNRPNRKELCSSLLIQTLEGLLDESDEDVDDSNGEVNAQITQ